MQVKEREIERNEQVPNNEKNGKIRLFKGMAIKPIRYIAALLLIAAAATLFIGKSKGTEIDAESSLKEIVASSDLSACEYTYNSIANVSDGKRMLYHVAYEGTVKAGFDFNEITVKRDREQKKVLIKIPDIKVNSVNVDQSSMEFIFDQRKSENNETIFQEAYSECLKDLRKKAENNKALKKMARENSISTIKALAEPWREAIPEGYELVCE